MKPKREGKDGTKEGMKEQGEKKRQNCFFFPLVFILGGLFRAAYSGFFPLVSRRVNDSFEPAQHTLSERESFLS